jgi:hypothetical protein
MANTLTYHPHRNHSKSLTDLLTNIGLGLKHLKITNTPTYMAVALFTVVKLVHFWVLYHTALYGRNHFHSSVS